VFGRVGQSLIINRSAPLGCAQREVITVKRTRASSRSPSAPPLLAMETAPAKADLREALFR